MASKLPVHRKNPDGAGYQFFNAMLGWIAAPAGWTPAKALQEIADREAAKKAEEDKVTQELGSTGDVTPTTSGGTALPKANYDAAVARVVKSIRDRNWLSGYGVPYAARLGADWKAWLVANKPWSKTEWDKMSLAQKRAAGWDGRRVMVFASYGGLSIDKLGLHRHVVTAYDALEAKYKALAIADAQADRKAAGWTGRGYLVAPDGSTGRVGPTGMHVIYQPWSPPSVYQPKAGESPWYGEGGVLTDDGKEEDLTVTSDTHADVETPFDESLPDDAAAAEKPFLEAIDPDEVVATESDLPSAPGHMGDVAFVEDSGHVYTAEPDEHGNPAWVDQGDLASLSAAMWDKIPHRNVSDAWWRIAFIENNGHVTTFYWELSNGEHIVTGTADSTSSPPLETLESWGMSKLVAEAHRVMGSGLMAYAERALLDDIRYAKRHPFPRGFVPGMAII